MEILKRFTRRILEISRVALARTVRDNYFLLAMSETHSCAILQKNHHLSAILCQLFSRQIYLADENRERVFPRRLRIPVTVEK